MVVNCSSFSPVNLYADLHTSLLISEEEMAKSPDIIIATPGSLMHHLSKTNNLSLQTVEYVVFVEADSLLNMGFSEQLRKILTQLSETRQISLFTATFPTTLEHFARANLRHPQLVNYPNTYISPDCKLTFFTLKQEEKLAALVYLVKEVINSEQKTLIFVSTKHHTELLKTLLKLVGIESDICYGNMSSEARKINEAKFKSGEITGFIVTDVACRGIDNGLIDNVINWDYPSKSRTFVQRVGRVRKCNAKSVLDVVQDEVRGCY